MYYKHDGSDTTDDRFRFAVELRTVGSEAIAIDHVITVNVTIQPINDEEFTLKPEAKLDVLQVTAGGFNGSSSLVDGAVAQGVECWTCDQ